MRSIPVLLQDSLDSYATTLCWCLEIVPFSGNPLRVTSQSRDVDFDNGDGVQTYSAENGLNMSSIEAYSGLEVGNAEAVILLGGEFTKVAIDAGVYDYAECYLYRVDWKDPSLFYTPFTGTVGAIRTPDQLSAVVELRSLSQTLKQNFVQLGSLNCRATHGSQVGDELFPCTVDVTPFWSNNSVVAVGAESDRLFTAATEPTATGPNGPLPFTNAIIEFQTGNNAGLTVETETVDVTAIALRFPSKYNIQIGDTFRIRPDCGKKYEENCINQYDNGLNFRGEPYIPVKEEGTSQTPGANVPTVGAPPIQPEPPPYTPPDTTGAVPYENHFSNFNDHAIVETATIWCPSGGKTLYFTVDQPTVAKGWGFFAVPIPGIIGTSQGSVSTVVGNYGAVPNNSILTDGEVIGGVIDSPETVAESPDLLREFIPGRIYFMNFKYNNGQANNIKIQCVWSDV